MPRLALHVAAPAGTEDISVEIGESGGWIGRATDNEVTLEDPTRTISSRHARVDWDGAGFGITDQSLNGTSINGQRLDRAERTKLRPGDTIGLGHYKLVVSDPTMTSAPPGAMQAAMPQAMPQSIPVMAPPPGPAAPGSDRFTLSLDDLIGPDAPPQQASPQQPATRRPLPSFGDPVPPPPKFAPPMFDEPPAPAPVMQVPAPEPPPYQPPFAMPPEPPPEAPPLPPLPDMWPTTAALPPQEPPSYQVPATRPENARSENDRASMSGALLLAAFWRGLGVGLPETLTPALMESLGQALHEAILGAATLLRPDGAAPRPEVRNNPLSYGIRGARQHVQSPQPQLGEHMRAAFAHQHARSATMQTAVEQAAQHLAETLSARALEERLGASVKSRTPLFRRAEFWRLYRDLEVEIREAAENRFRKDLTERLRAEPKRLGLGWTIMMRTLLAILLLGLVAACSDSPTRVTINMSATTGLNPNSDNQPSPTVVRIYELKSVDVFNQLSFFDLFDQDTAKLGGDLLNRREIELRPGRSETITREADPAARFIGVVAGYRTIADITWRASAALDPESRNTVVIRLDPRSLSVVKQKPSRFLWIF